MSPTESNVVHLDFSKPVKRGAVEVSSYHHACEIIIDSLRKIEASFVSGHTAPETSPYQVGNFTYLAGPSVFKIIYQVRPVEMGTMLITGEYNDTDESSAQLAEEIIAWLVQEGAVTDHRSLTSGSIGRVMALTAMVGFLVKGKVNVYSARHDNGAPLLYIGIDEHSDSCVAIFPALL
jgi:hypothetical protein